MNEKDAVHLQELRRGTVVLACLMALRDADYGYALLERLDQSGFDVGGDTLYPLLRRLESQGLLVSEWDTGKSRPRKFYRTSDEGHALAVRLTADWDRLTESLHVLRGTTP